MKYWDILRVTSWFYKDMTWPVVRFENNQYWVQLSCTHVILWKNVEDTFLIFFGGKQLELIK